VEAGLGAELGVAVDVRVGVAALDVEDDSGVVVEQAAKAPVAIEMVAIKPKL
jgi:hypothetical protein